MSKKIIMFLDGVPDNQKLIVRKVEKNGKIRWAGSGSTNVSHFLKSGFFNQLNIIFDLKADQVLPNQMIHAVFNQISDPDSHQKVLRKAESFYKIVSKHVPFFNAPSNVMKTTRDNIYQLLQGIDKLHIPKTIRITPKSPSYIYKMIEKENFDFPVIFRRAGDHGGISTIRIDDESEKFYSFPLDGRDYYLTQFVESAEDGVYSKYRLVVVDGEVFLRHIIVSNEWMVHRKSQLPREESDKFKNKVAKEFDQNIKPGIAPIVTEIYKRLNLDYFGIDCSIDKDMNLLIFEINANMSVFETSKNSVFTEHIEMAKQALIKMLLTKSQS